MPTKLTQKARRLRNKIINHYEESGHSNGGIIFEATTPFQYIMCIDLVNNTSGKCEQTILVCYSSSYSVVSYKYSK